MVFELYPNTSDFANSLVNSSYLLVKNIAIFFIGKNKDKIIEKIKEIESRGRYTH